MAKTIKAYKGFNKDLKCRDFQYEVGKEYEMDNDIQLCKRGFHACESPFDVLDFYGMYDAEGRENRFAEVEMSGTINKDDDGNSTKICSSKIKIKAEIGFKGLINAGIEWIKEVTKAGKAYSYCGKKRSIRTNNGHPRVKVTDDACGFYEEEK